MSSIPDPATDPAYRKLLDEHIARAWPLRFKTHGFGSRCYNTLRCGVYYDKDHFTRLYANKPSGQPQDPNWKDSWHGRNLIGRGFPPPAEIEWTSLDGTEHHAFVDIGEIFKDRLILHNVPKEGIPEGWLAACDVKPPAADILMEVNDRTINVYMRAHITTKEPQIPGNPRSTHRSDLILAWTKTY